ncbi:MAG: PfkB family carbohydrate kinase, partial [Chloroflexota bacterium]|nr:PfkB family carbohydrate kinase [Chloroflexota bacterium]
MSSPLNIVSHFQNLRALVIGDLMLDSYLEGRASRLCREGPVPVISRTHEERVPGGAANTAANLQALGAHVVMLGVVGTDTAGEHLHNTLQRLGVDTSRVVRDPSVSTLHKLRLLANGQY